MLVMGLRGADYDFVKTNSGKRKEVFYCAETNNTLVFNPTCKENDRASICGYTVDDAFLPLIDLLNGERNLVVYWYQVEGTTSDYTVYKDMHLSVDELKSYRKIMKRLDESVIEGDVFRYKYNIVENGVVRYAFENEGELH